MAMPWDPRSEPAATGRSRERHSGWRVSQLVINYTLSPGHKWIKSECQSGDPRPVLCSVQCHHLTLRDLEQTVAPEASPAEAGWVWGQRQGTVGRMGSPETP